jgi:hypothetical protein
MFSYCINYINYSSHGIVFTLGEKGGGVLTFQMIAREQRNIFVCTLLLLLLLLFLLLYTSNIIII